MTHFIAKSTSPYCFSAPHRKHLLRCNVTAHGCTCSAGCATSWRCRPSAVCDTTHSFSPPASSLRESARIESSVDDSRVAILLFLAFNSSLVRSKYAHRPHAAYEREFNRIVWFLRSATKVKTQLPIHVIVGPERYPEHERTLQKLGANITVGMPVPAPAWASKYHLMSFAKIGALALTQFDRVWVFDNDMALVGNVDDLAYAPTPAAVWHTAIGAFQVKSGETCAVTTGLLGLSPSMADFRRAMRRLHSATENSYDGGDQGFWRKFYTFYELPVRYHAHQALVMPDREWEQVRVLHSISGLRSWSRLPDKLRSRIAYFY